MNKPDPRMSSNRPYLLRAVYQWISDNGLTPYLLVDARQPQVRVPVHTVKDGQVVLNIAMRAVSELELANDAVRFMARFGGVSHQVRVPIAAVLAIYAHENGQGMMFPPEPVDETADPATDPPPPDAPAKRKGPSLRVIK
ncbi:MAG: ClpXP protease specificity-enhancing factor [Lysobacterales bacterium]